MSIQIGTKIRSYDFEGRRDCYIEGVVTRLDMDDMWIYATATRVVFSGEEKKSTKEFRTVFPGAMAHDWQGRVTVIR